MVMQVTSEASRAINQLINQSNKIDILPDAGGGKGDEVNVWAFSMPRRCYDTRCSTYSIVNALFTISPRCRIYNIYPVYLMHRRNMTVNITTASFIIYFVIVS